MAKTRKIVNETLRPLPDPKALLAWYDKAGRDLPWRRHQGRAASPYETWIAEIMLQQTTVATVIPYYERFLAAYPDVHSLAAANEQDVLALWAGLGYYSRARNLLRCANQLARDHDGVFPSEITALTALPGIGTYTANAIRAIAHDLPSNVVDGNVERVMARIFAYDKPINTPEAKRHLSALALSLAPRDRPGDYAQALMDLGAMICTPRNPGCPACPWRGECRAFLSDMQNTLPLKTRKAAIPVRHAACIVIRDSSGRHLLRQRPQNGLLGGLWEFPSTAWEMTPAPRPDGLYLLAPSLNVQMLDKPVNHVFSHFKLVMTVGIAQTNDTFPEGGQWFPPEAFPPLSTLTKKIFTAAQNAWRK